LGQRSKSGSASDRDAVFDRDFLEDLRYWIETDRKTALRVLQIVEAVLRDTCQGIGKPEPLKHLLAGAWSRRLTQQHRVVYLVSQERVVFLQARYHY
jgi:toxin YoeB